MCDADWGEGKILPNYIMRLYSSSNNILNLASASLYQKYNNTWQHHTYSQPNPLNHLDKIEINIFKTLERLAANMACISTSSDKNILICGAKLAVAKQNFS